jgi:hypothetical protein
MFKRNYEQFLRDQNSSLSANIPSYVMSNGQLVATNSSLPPVALGPPIDNATSSNRNMTVAPLNNVQIVDDTVSRRRVIQSRRILQNPYQPGLSQRENLLLNTNITEHYDEQSEELRRNIINPVSNDWIFSSSFAEGAFGFARNITNTNFFRDSNTFFHRIFWYNRIYSIS